MEKEKQLKNCPIHGNTEHALYVSGNHMSGLWKFFPKVTGKKYCSEECR